MNMHEQELQKCSALALPALQVQDKDSHSLNLDFDTIVSYLLHCGVKFLFLVTSHVPLIHTVSPRTSKTRLERVSAQKWQAYLKATPLYYIRLPTGLSEKPRL